MNLLNLLSGDKQRGAHHEIKSLYLHLGAHKTATSYLQHNLSANKRFFKNHNSLYVHPNYKTTPGVTDLIEWYRRSDWQDTSIPKEFIAYLEKLRHSPYDSVLLSSESILGRMSLKRTGVITPTHSRVTTAIKECFTDQDIKVAFSFRNYTDYIESTYKWLLTIGEGSSFNHYLNRVDLQNISWVPIAENLIDTFGKDSVIFWRYEHYKKNSQKVDLDVLKFFYGESMSGFKYSKVKAVNSSVGKDGVRLLQAINSSVSKLESVSKKEKIELREKLKTVMQPYLYADNADPALLPAEIRKMLDEKYKKDIDTIARTYGKRFN